MWTPQICQDKHRGLMRTNVFILVSIIGMTGVFAWFVDNQQSTDAVAQQALQECRVEKATNDEYKKNLNDAVLSLKSWTKDISAKQDKLNDSMQRLIAIYEAEKK